MFASLKLFDETGLMANDIHVGDVGTIFQLTIQELPANAGANASPVPVDISEATLQFVFVSASKKRFVVTPILTTDGTDGNCQYATRAGDLDQSGSTWKLQAIVAIGGGSWSTDVVTFSVLTNL